jgi:hypothetical protein
LVTFGAGCPIARRSRTNTISTWSLRHDAEIEREDRSEGASRANGLDVLRVPALRSVYDPGGNRVLDQDSSVAAAARAHGMNALRFRRDDELETFIRLDTRHTIVWAAGRNEGCIWHATEDGIYAICSRKIVVDLDADPYPSTVDRSNDLMTCVRCQDHTARVRSK